MRKSTELYEQAYILENKKNDLVSALEIYRKIISLFPDSTEAEYSRDKIKKSEQLLAQVALRAKEKEAAKLKKQQAERERLVQQEKEREKRVEREKIAEGGDAHLYEKFTTEIESDDFDRAVWSKASAIHYGDKDKAKYEYVKLKVDDVKARLGLSGSEIGEKKNSPKAAASSSKPTTRSDTASILYKDTKSNQIATGLESGQPGSGQNKSISQRSVFVALSWLAVILAGWGYTLVNSPYVTGIDFVFEMLGAVFGASIISLLLVGLMALTYRGVTHKRMPGIDLAIPITATVMAVIAMYPAIYIY